MLPSLAPAPSLDGPLLALALRDVPALGPQDTLFDAARLMAARRVPFVPVLDAQGRALGVITEALLLGAAYGPQGPQQDIGSVMQPPCCVPHGLDAAAGFQRCMAQGGSPLLLVDDEQRVVALVGEGEFRTHLQLALMAGQHRVSALMARVLRPLSPQDTLAQAVAQMRTSTSAGSGSAVVVTENEHAVGVLTARDVARLVAARADLDRVLLSEVMSHPVLSLPIDATINQAADRMLSGRVRHLVVLDAAGLLVGVLDEHELTRAMAVQVMDAGIEQERLRQRALLDAIPDPVWLKDPAGVYLTCNPRFERLYGAPEAQIRGRTDDDFVSPEQAEFFRLHDRRAMAQGGPSVNEEVLTYADGHRERVQTIKSPVRDGQGRLLGVLGIARDITALRQAEEEYRWLFARNPAPMYLYDRETLALRRVNEAFCALYGYTEAEAATLLLTDLLPEEDREGLRQRVGAAQGLVSTGDRRHLRRDGSVLQVMVRSHDSQHEGRACRISVVTDVGAVQRTRQRDRQRLALMERVARGDSLESLLAQLARDHEALFPDSLCSVLLVGEDGTTLRHGAAPSLPPAYVQAIDGVAIGPAVGSCGAAAHSGQRVVVEDIEAHPNWVAFLEHTRAAGLRACWSEPIVGSGDTLLGTFAVYRRQPAAPESEELDHMQFAVQLAANAITHGSTTRALRASERRLREVLQAIPDMVWQKDADGVYRICNAAFARMAGLPIERIIGSRDEDITSPDRAALFRQQDEQVLGTRQPLSLERWMTIRSTGQHVLTELIKTPLFDDDGQPAGVLGVARDITLIKQGAHVAAEQQRLIDTMLDQTTDSIVLVDPATLQFVTFNDAACLGLGYTRERFAGLTPRDLQADQELPEIRDNVQRAMAGEQIRFDTRHRRADGAIQDAAITLRRITYGGRPLLSSVWRDVTEQRRNEARIQRLNRSYAVLSAVNEAVVRLHDREALFAEVCRIAAEAGGFGLAWIGQLDEASGEVLTLARGGRSEDFSQSLRLKVKGPDAPGANGPIGRALATGRPCVVQDIETSSLMPRRRLTLLEQGHRALGTFPILPAGGQQLVLVVYSQTVGHFDDEQVSLFERLAQDVAFALEFIAAQQASDEAQRFREQLIESVAGLFFALDASGRLLLWNKRMEEVSGYAAHELATRQAADFFSARERPLVAERLRGGFERGEVEVEAQFISRNGRRTPYLFVARRLDMAQGPLLVGTGVDISARVRSERRLTRYGNQLGYLVQQRTAELQDANARLQREDRRLRAMLDLSQRASTLDEGELFRLGLQAILAQSGSPVGCVRSVRNGDAPLLLQAWAGMESPPPEMLPLQVLAQGQPCMGEGEAARGLCALPVDRVLGVPVMDGTRPVLVVCVANKPEPYQDADARELQLLASDLWAIVQRRRIEIALGEAKLAADAANQAKSAFLANMSHEIRTPMNAVIGFAHLLRRDPLTARQRDHLGKITDAGQHLLQVINDILDFSKIEAHKVTLEDTDFPLRDCLDRVKAMQLDAARAKQLPLVLDLAADCPDTLRGDRLRLEQILLNLLSNAVKFTARGRVDLRVRRLADRDPAPDRDSDRDSDPALWLRFEVSDTGIGLSEDELAHVFEAFAQADVSTTRRFGGTGLGLAISKRLVQLMNGRMGAESQPGVGSTFWVELPLKPAQAPVPARPVGVAPVADSAALRGLCVLVAEDNPINQEVTSTLLAALGVSAQVVASGEEVLQAFDAGRHDLILMDVQMPGMDGLRATAALRLRPDGAAVPIIAMTANAFSEDRQLCLAAGMNDHLPKPVEPAALERCLLRWGRAALAPAPLAAATPAATAARSRLQALDGLDTRSALSRMRGAWPLYLRTLRMFVDHHADDADRLADPALAGDPGALRALAHSLAGAAATVGAVEVQARARALQQQLDGGGAPPDADRRALAVTLRSLVQQVQALLQDEAGPRTGVDAGPVPGAAPGPGPSPAARSAARTVLLQLQPLVSDHDTAALGLYERHRPLLEEVLGPEARALARHLGTFSFAAAQATLGALLQRPD